MKLNEINYYKNREIDQSEYDKIPSQMAAPVVNKTNKRFYRPSIYDGPTKRSGGVYATVIKDKLKPVVHKLTASDAGYKYFVEKVTTDPAAKDNPHFPRFHKITYGRQNSAHYEMEKLHMTLEEYIESDDEAIDMIINLYLDDQAVKSLNRLSYDAASMLAAILQCIYSSEKNPAWGQAIELVTRKWVEEINSNSASPLTIQLDLHANNIMVRATSTGPQLVIIDPYTGHVAKWGTINET